MLFHGFVRVFPGDAGKQGEHIVEQQKPLVTHEEAPPGVTGTATLGVFDTYIFRGYELSKDSIVIQPGMSASYGGFSASFWGNIDSKEQGTQNFVPIDQATKGLMKRILR